MNDELGTALRDALAAPDVTADRWAGQVLRRRAALRRERRARRLSALSAAAMVILLVGGFAALLRPAGGGGGTPGPLRSTGPAVLGVPLTVQLGGDASPFLTVREVTALTVVDRELMVSLTEPDAKTIAAVTSVSVGRSVIFRAGDVTIGPVTLLGPLDSPLSVPTTTDAGAVSLLVALDPEPVDAAAVRVGPGPLDLPLELRGVRELTGPPCSPAGTVALADRCVLLGRTYVRVTQVADLRMGPGLASPGDPVSVTLRLMPADVAKLPSPGTAGLFVYTAGGVPVGQVLAAVPGSPLSFAFRDAAEASLFVARLRR